MGILLGELSASDPATRPKLTPASATAAVEIHYCAAKVAHLVEQRLAAAEVLLP